MPITATLRPPLRTVSNQNAAQFIRAHHQIIRPLDLRLHAQLVQSLPAGKRRHQCQRAQFVLRPLKSPAQAKHQAFAQAVLPAFALPPAAAALLVRHHQRTVGGSRRLFGLFQHAIVAGGAFIQQGRLKAVRGGDLLHPRSSNTAKGRHQPPLAVVLARKAADMRRHLLPRATPICCGLQAERLA